MRNLALILGTITLLSFVAFLVITGEIPPQTTSRQTIPEKTTSPSPATIANHPFFLETVRQKPLPPSVLTIEEALPAGTNHSRFLATYTSESFKIYGLLTVPTGTPPVGGFPAIVFLHGYIPPDQYQTTQGYSSSQAGLADSGFVTFKPDLRGHGQSEGEATGAHFSHDYVIDTLQAIDALQAYPQINPGRIGVWGHSNGGEIGLRAMVLTPEIKAGVFWAGVVGSFEDMLETYRPQIPFMRRISSYEEQFGLPSQNREFWQQADPYTYLSQISAPIQLHHGTADPQVPHQLSRHLETELKQLGKVVSYHEYEDANHNFSGAIFNQVMQRTVDFFRQNL